MISRNHDGRIFKSLRKAYMRKINIVHHHLPSPKVPRRDNLDIIFSKRVPKGSDRLMTIPW